MMRIYKMNDSKGYKDHDREYRREMNDYDYNDTYERRQINSKDQFMRHGEDNLSDAYNYLCDFIEMAAKEYPDAVPHLAEAAKKIEMVQDKYHRDGDWQRNGDMEDWHDEFNRTGRVKRMPRYERVRGYDRSRR